MKEKFMEWVKSTDQSITIKDSSRTCHFFRFPRNKSLDLIFCQSIYHSNHIVNNDFKYYAIYDNRTCELHDIKYNLAHCLGIKNNKNYSENCKEGYGKDYVEKVQEKLNILINNDINNTLVKSDEEIRNKNWNMREIEYIREHRADNDVRQYFLAGNVPSDIVFNACYTISEWTYDLFIEYLMDEEASVNKGVENMLEKKADDIYKQFVENAIIREDLAKLIAEADEGNELYIARNIINAIKPLDIKTVKVTINMNDKELTFKTDANQYTYYSGNKYWGYNVASADRVAYAKMFGNINNDYLPSNIVRITHGKKVLYENVKLAN